MVLCGTAVIDSRAVKEKGSMKGSPYLQVAE
jgi:hypothetical protein